MPSPSMRMRVRQALYALRGWLRSLVFEWPTEMRLVTPEGPRTIARVIRHEVVGGTHILIEDIDGLLYVWPLSDVKRYGPVRRIEVPVHVIGEPIPVVS